MQTMIVLTSAKGGVGKSTLAVNLAGALAGRGQAALIDEDRELSTSSNWVRRAEGRLPLTLVAAGEAAPPGTRYVVMDTEGRPAVSDMVELTRLAGVMLIPTGTNVVEMEAAAGIWRRLQAQGGQMARVRVVVTKAPPTGQVGQAARDALRESGLQVCETVIRAYAAHQQAAGLGRLVRDVPDPRAVNAWADVLELALEVC
jgi:chromosome partitioning protein